METILRQILLSDAAAIASLAAQLGYSISIAQTLENIEAINENKDHAAFVAEHNGLVAGWIGISYVVQLESPPSCEIHGLVVNENHRKQGIGKLLIEKARQWSLQKNVDRLRLRCNVIRTETHKFYLHLGFREIKQQKVFEIDL